MSGSPPQMEIMGAPHSVAAPRQSSSDIMSFSEVEYSRIRPQPVQVRLQVWSGSSWSTVANFSTRRTFFPMMWVAILAVSASGNLIKSRTFYKRWNLQAMFEISYKTVIPRAERFPEAMRRGRRPRFWGQGGLKSEDSASAGSKANG